MWTSLLAANIACTTWSLNLKKKNVMRPNRAHDDPHPAHDVPKLQIKNRSPETDFPLPDRRETEYLAPASLAPLVGQKIHWSPRFWSPWTAGRLLDFCAEITSTLIDTTHRHNRHTDDRTPTPRSIPFSNPTKHKHKKKLWDSNHFFGDHFSFKTRPRPSSCCAECDRPTPVEEDLLLQTNLVHRTTEMAIPK